MATVGKLYTHQEAEKFLEDRFKGKYVKFSYPGREPDYGLVDQISIENLSEPLVILQMNDQRYTCSIEAIKDCITLLKK